MPFGVLKTDAARIIKLDVANVPTRVLETLLFWDQKVKGQGHRTKNRPGVGVCTVVSAGVF